MKANKIIAGLKPQFPGFTDREILHVVDKYRAGILRKKVSRLPFNLSEYAQTLKNIRIRSYNADSNSVYLKNIDKLPKLYTYLGEPAMFDLYVDSSTLNKYRCTRVPVNVIQHSGSKYDLIKAYYSLTTSGDLMLKIPKEEVSLISMLKVDIVTVLESPSEFITSGEEFDIRESDYPLSSGDLIEIVNVLSNRERVQE